MFHLILDLLFLIRLKLLHYNYINYTITLITINFDKDINLSIKIPCKVALPIQFP